VGGIQNLRLMANYASVCAHPRRKVRRVSDEVSHEDDDQSI
jgi:hypothetical protein